MKNWRETMLRGYDPDATAQRRGERYRFRTVDGVWRGVEIIAVFGAVVHVQELAPRDPKVPRERLRHMACPWNLVDV